MTRSQSGFTLIELLVASTIGLILIAATGQIFLSNRQSFTAQEAMGNIQENARLAMFFLQRDIRMAGFPKNGGQEPVVFNTGACNVNSALFCTDIAGTGTVNGGGNAADQIEIQTQSRLDCLGRLPVNAALPEPWYVRNRYFVQVDADGVSRLMCQSFQLDVSNTVRNLNGGSYANAANGGGAQPMVDGIETLQLLYGVDSDSDLSTDNPLDRATRYLRADSIPNTDLLKVVSVRIGILASSIAATSGVRTADNAAQRYLVLDAPIFTRNDLLRRRVFTSTVEIRNQIQ